MNFMIYPSHPHTLTHQLHGDESLRETKSSREEDTREKEGGRKGRKVGSGTMVVLTFTRSKSRCVRI